LRWLSRLKHLDSKPVIPCVYFHKERNLLIIIFKKEPQPYIRLDNWQNAVW
jgi:hypothetical protein